MRTLPTKFTKAGFEYEQQFRQGNVAIYKQTKAGQPANVHYEVGKIRDNKERDAFGQHFEAAESWPTSEEWGIRAWTYTDYSRAKQRALSLIPSNG